MEIMTKRFSLKAMYPDLAKSLAAKYEMDEDAIELIRKGLAVDSRSYFKEDEKASIDYITTKYADRDGQIVVPSGIDLSEYRLTPVVLYCHDYKTEELPIGKNIWIKADDRGLIAKTKYHTREGTLGKKVYDYLADGFPLATSIGFVGLKLVPPDDYHTLDFKSLGLDVKEVKKAVNGIFTNSLLLEYSRVPVASNAQSVNIAVNKSLFVQDDILNFGIYTVIDPFKGDKDEIQTTEKEEGQKEVEIVTKPETTENYHHIPVSDGHDGHKIRTITISTSKGIKALYCVDCKKIKTYLFSTDKFTMEEAQAWIDDHSKKFVDEVSNSSDMAIKALNDDLSDLYEEIIKSPEKDCDCEEFQGEDVVCNGCGGKRKPKKDVGYIQGTGTKQPEGVIHVQCDGDIWGVKQPDSILTVKAQCTCSECDDTFSCEGDTCPSMCPECAREDEDDIEEDGCKPKPKKDINEIEIIEKVGLGTTTPNILLKVDTVRWNKSLSKLFDVASVPSVPASYTMKIFCQFLECKVRNIYQNNFFIWSPLIGSYLAGFKACTKDFKLKDTRAFSRYEQLEYPPSYEVIRINSKTQDDFLVQGSAFYEHKGEPIILDFSPDMYGMNVSVFTARKNMEMNKDFMKAVHNWVETENPLRNEKMGLNGEFLEVDEKDNWDTIVLSKDNLAAGQYAQKLINEKGSDFSGRGMLLVGKPGEGKTKLARILMAQTKHTFIWVSSKDLTRTYYPEDKIALGFKLARQLQPSILCLEDIDNWIDGKIVDMMKTELDGVKKNKGVITILTTNSPEKLPSALLDRPGRFHDVLNFDAPTKELRAEMILRWAGHDIEDDKGNHILDATEGFSGAYMWELIEFAKDISEEKEIPIGDALLASLAKLQGQKELISSIQKPKEKTIDIVNRSSVPLDIETVKSTETPGEINIKYVLTNKEKVVPVGVDNLEFTRFTERLEDVTKSGRRLSSTSITQLREALKLIEDLIATSDPIPKEEEKTITFEVPKKDPDSELMEVLAKGLAEAFEKGVNKVFDVNFLVSEGIKRAKGEMF